MECRLCGRLAFYNAHGQFFCEAHKAEAVAREASFVRSRDASKSSTEQGLERQERVERSRRRFHQHFQQRAR